MPPFSLCSAMTPHLSSMIHIADCPQASARAARLSFLLEKSGVYAEIIGKRMEAQRIERAKAEHRAAVREANKKTKQAEIEASSERRSGRTAKPVAVEEKSGGLVRRTTRKRKVENVQAENDKAEVAAEPAVDVKVEDAAAVGDSSLPGSPR